MSLASRKQPLNALMGLIFLIGFFFFFFFNSRLIFRVALQPVPSYQSGHLELLIVLIRLSLTELAYVVLYLRVSCFEGQTLPHFSNVSL